MEPELKSVEEMKVVGLETRTTNREEMSPSTARIPALGGRFYQEQIMDKIPSRKPNGFPVGVYSKYERDHTGPYSLLAGAEVSDLKAIPNGMTGLAIPACKYLVFTAQGPMPQALIQMWATIWNYFSSGSKYDRAYTADFELYRASDKVDIHIAIK